MMLFGEVRARVHEVNCTAMFTVYDSPVDVPGFIVVRLFIVNKHGAKPTAYAWTFLDLVEARHALEREGLFPLPRDEADDPKIVETWL